MRKGAFICTALLVFFFLCGCDNAKRNIPFPANETAISQVFNQPLLFTDSGAINWITPSPDSVSLPSVKKFDFSKIPARPFDMGGFKPIKAPLDTKKIEWNNIPDSVFNLDQLPDSALRVKTFILPKPKKIKTSVPELKEGSSSGLYEFALAQGLPGVKVTSMVQDNEDMIWLIADGQLYRHNGEYLEQFVLHGSPYLSRIMQDRSGIIWAASYSNTLYRIDARAGMQNLITTSAMNLFNLVEDNTGLVWVGTFGIGIYIIDWNKQTFKNYQRFAEFTHKNTVYDIIQDKRDRIWLVGGNGAMVCDVNKKSVKFLSTVTGLSSNNIVSISEDKQSDGMWICMAATDSVINVISPSDGTITYLGKKQGIGRNIWRILEDRQQRHWLSADSTIYLLDEEFEKLKEISVNGRQASNDIGCILQLKQGQVWIGSTTAGISIIDPNGLMPEYLDASRGIGGNGIWGLAEDDKSHLWIGGNTKDSKAYSGFLNVIDSSGKSIYDLTGEIDSSFYSIRGGICKDGKGKIYCGFERGVLVFDQDNKTVTHIGKRQGLRDPEVQCIMADSRGFIWIGTWKGVYRFEPASGALRFIEGKSEITEVYAYCLFEDSDKQIWIGSYEKGTYIIDSSLSNIKHFSSGRGGGGDNVFCFSEDKKGQVWIATENGVIVADKRQRKIKVLSIDDGLNDSAAYVLQLVDDRMYAGTKNGLTIFVDNETLPAAEQKASWKVSSFDKNNGLFYQDFNSLSLRTRNGKLWFGIDQKIGAVIDEPVIDDSISTTTYLTGINFFDQPQNFSDFNFVSSGLIKDDTIWAEEKDSFYLKGQWPAASSYQRKNGISLDSTIGAFYTPVNLQLPYSQNYLSFRFNNAAITGREKIRYRYILEGIDRNWTEASEKTISENYRDLAPGKYTFKVRCKGINGIWSNPAELSFTILPPWWKTWWAYLLYVLFFSIIIMGVVQYRSRWLKKENQRLEQMVTQRTNELSQSLNELRATQTQLIQSEKMASLGQLTAGIAHEIQNPLNFVNNFSEVNKELLSEMKEEMDKGNLNDAKAIANDVIDNEEKINHHGKRADAIVKGMLQHSRSSSGIKEPTDINALADEYLRLAYHGLRAKDKTFNATTKTDYDENIGNVGVIPQDIGRVILNLITNAFYAVTERGKQAGKDYEPTVIVSTKKLNDNVEIRVKDNGAGIPQKILDKIFQPFFTTKPTGQGTGLGLSLSYDIVKAHGGEIKVETTESEGTEFIVQLPA